MKFTNIFKKKNKKILGYSGPILEKKEETLYNPIYNNYEELFKNISSCKKEKHINMLCIADTHGCLLFSANGIKEKLEKELNDGCDVVICLGDIRKDELRIINNIVKDRFPIIGIKGNHDDFNQFEEYPNIIDLNCKTIEINDVKIAGLSGCIKYKDNDDICYTQNESLKVIKEIPEADILITHAHMYRANDKYKSEYDCHIGLVGALKYFYDNKCFLNIHGHDHLNSELDTEIRKNNGKSIGVYQIERIII